MMRKFETGATRNVDSGKFDYEAFYTPRVLRAFATYMHFNRLQENGEMRDGDNWQRGIPMPSYMKSGFRHFIDWWSWHRGEKDIVKEGIVWALCGVIFNAQGYLDSILQEHPEYLDEELNTNTKARETRWAKNRKD